MALKDVLRSFSDTRILIPRIDRHLLSLNGENARRNDGFIHPSGVSGCLMAQYLCMNKVPAIENIPAKVRRIFNNGDHMHSRLQKYMLDAGITKPNPANKNGEWPFEIKKWRVRGQTDGIILNPEAILELKSMNEREFLTLGGPKAEHIWQGHLYMWGLNIKKIIFLYENKNNQDLKEFVMEWDQETFDTVFERIKYLNKCYLMNTPPNKWTCNGAKSCNCNISNYTEEGQKMHRRLIK